MSCVDVFLTEAPRFVEIRLRETAGFALVLFFETDFFFDTAVFVDRFLDAVLADAALFAVVVRFLETDFFAVFFLDAEVPFFDLRVMLAAGRFLRLAPLRAVLRTVVFRFDVFFLVAALFAGIIGLQDRLNQTGDYTDATEQRKA